MVRFALMVDRDGLLTAVSVDVGSGTAAWTGPDRIGAATLVPGSPVTVFQQSTTVTTVLMVDRDGLLNAVSVDVGSGTAAWTGPDRIGTATLVPGSPVTVLQPGSSEVIALIVDSNGMLNAATLNLAAGAPWQGPGVVGNAPLVPGSPVTSGNY